LCRTSMILTSLGIAVAVLVAFNVLVVVAFASASHLHERRSALGVETDLRGQQGDIDIPT
jgi:hypothetical protein